MIESTQMAESVELAGIRRAAFLRALHRAVENPSVTVVPVTSLAHELGLRIPQLKFVIDPVVSEGLITVHGGIDSGAVTFTEKGLLEANELLNRRYPSRAKVKILCVDTEPETVQRIKDVGYALFDVSMGYRTGKRNFPFPPPNEVNLIVCDLRRPACFDRQDWGPGRSNSNSRCKVIPYDRVNIVFYVVNERRQASQPVIYESQLGKQIPGTFGPKEVNRAIVEAGVPFLLFLNQEWLSRIDLFPNWLDVSWSFLPTSATEVRIVDPVSTLLPELGSEVKLKLAIQHRIEKGPMFVRTPPLFPISTQVVVDNNIGDIFGQFVRMGKGSVWLLPATHQNADVVELFASRLEMVKQLADTSQKSPSVAQVGHGAPVKRILGTRPTTTEGTSPSMNIEVFISHSNADVGIALELINLLKSAIPDLRPELIRCTSVPGYRLEGGAKTEEQLRKELLQARVFIGLLSKQSLQSTYVLFELGARWGAEKHLLPLLVAGMTASDLKAPLSGLNAHSAAIDSHLFQLVDEVGSRLGLTLAKAPVYESQIKKVVQISNEARQIRQP